MEWYVRVLKKYFVFEGRARRAEYWFFNLFNVLISLGFLLLMGLIAAVTGSLGNPDSSNPAVALISIISLLSNLYSLAVLLPALGVGVRRLHDTNRSGWWILIGLVPLIGWIVLLVFFCQDSQFGRNEYGPNPKNPAV